MQHTSVWAATIPWHCSGNWAIKMYTDSCASKHYLPEATSISAAFKFILSHHNDPLSLIVFIDPLSLIVLCFYNPPIYIPQVLDEKIVNFIVRQHS